MRMTQMNELITAAALIATGALAGCSRHETSGGTVAQDSTATPAAASSASPSTSGPGASPDTIVRGTVTNVSDSVLTLSTSAGDVRIALTQPAKVYSREPGDLSRVTDRSFVGVTSVPGPGGTQRATEIHVFPEELRGLGEGSRPMGAAATGRRSTMTNGSIANSRMMNGAARMTNGTSRGAAGGTITVEYKGGSQTIAVPAGVAVTVIAPTVTKLTPGASVVVPANKQPDGTIKASLIVLAGAEQSRK